jgi:hypothetical protein
VITQGFVTAALQRAQALGMPEHPVIVTEHPIASKKREHLLKLARHSVEEVVSALVSSMRESHHA